MYSWTAFVFSEKTLLKVNFIFLLKSGRGGNPGRGLLDSPSKVSLLFISLNK
jgi:hypothetical protein